MIRREQWIDSRLCGFLLEEDPDAFRILAVYATLLKYRTEGHYYAPSNGLSGYKLLKVQTGISENTLRGIVPTLIGMGLGYFTPNGGFFLTGRKKVNELFENKRGKMVPVTIGKTFCETKGNVGAIYIITNINRQQKMIDKKVTLNKVLKALEKGRPVSGEDAQLILNTHKGKKIDLENLNKVENTILSNKRFSELITGDSGEKTDKKVSHGHYWKKMFENRSIITTRRRFECLWDKKMSFKEYLHHKKAFTEIHGYVTFRKGRIVKPIASEIGANFQKPSLSYNTILYTNIYSNNKETLGEVSTSLPE